MTAHPLTVPSQACKAFSTLWFAIFVGLLVGHRSDITARQWTAVVVLWLAPAALSVHFERLEEDARKATKPRQE